MVFIDFRYVLSQWESIGLFDVILPMILIFTIVFAILKKSKILGGIPGIDAIISIVVAIFSISNPAVSSFFMPIFSNFALGIIVLLSVLLFMGLVFGEKREGMYWIGILGAVAIFIWIMSRVFSIYGVGYGYYPDWFSDNLIWIIPLILAVIGIVSVIASGEKKSIGNVVDRLLRKVVD